MTNDQKFEAGLAALVDLYLFYAKGAGGPERVFSTPEKSEAAFYFVTEFQKRTLDAGPQPTPAGERKPVTNFYDAPAGPVEDSAKAAAAPVGESSPPPPRAPPRDPAAELAAANAPPPPPSASAIDALMSED